MIKSIASALTALLLVASIGYAANMQVNASAVPVSGGTITPNGIKFYAGAATYTAAPKAGWTLSKVQIDGVDATAPYTVPFDTSKVHTVKATFAQTLYSITTTVPPTANGIGGTISVAGGSQSNITPGSTRAYTVTPFAGSSIASVTTNGLPAANSGTFANIQANIAIAATFTANPTANLVVYAGPNQTVGLLPGGNVATLTGTTSVPAPPYQWKLVSGPAGSSFSAPTALTTGFLAGATGSYVVALTASGVTSAPATITVVNPGVISAGSKPCITCHAGSAPVVKYSASGHAESISGPSCAACHAGADTGHPGAKVASATCESCHTPALSQITHPPEITASKCLVCHNPHDPADGIANIGPTPAHPAVTLYTFEEIGMQMAGGAKVPVQVDASGKGMPYSPKQTCGTAGCHVKNGIDYTYDKISDHAFHSNEGRSEYIDSSNGKFDATKNKPWGQSTAMVGKW